MIELGKYNRTHELNLKRDAEDAGYTEVLCTNGLAFTKDNNVLIVETSGFAYTTTLGNYSH